MRPDFAARSAEPELMDEPGIPDEELRQTLGELAFINRALGGYGPSLEGLEALCPAGARALSLLDVGCGGGDTARRMADWARRRGLRLSVVGIDLSEAAVEFARAESRDYPALRFERRDLWEIPGKDRYDVVHSALVLHHFPGDGAVRALRRMYELSRYGVVLNDLHRHPVAYAAIGTLTRTFSHNRLIRHYAPLSVLRAFSRDGLLALAREAGLPDPELRWRWPFRWRMVVRKWPTKVTTW